MHLLEIENLSKLNEVMPESLPRELNVLVIARNGDQLTLASPATGLDEVNRKRVEDFVNQPVTWVSHDTDEISDAINVAYGTIRNVEGCSWNSDTQCPQYWDQLEKTDNRTIRNCGVCNKPVYLCFNNSDQYAQHVELGNCFCFVAQKLEGEPSDSVLDDLADHHDDAG
jgi:hypothetical protein